MRHLRHLAARYLRSSETTKEAPAGGSVGGREAGAGHGFARSTARRPRGLLLFERCEDRSLLAGDPVFADPIVPGTLEGTAWRDFDSNGLRGPNEPGLAGVTVYLDMNRNLTRDADEPFRVTSSDDPGTVVVETGRYAFASLEPGFYTLRQEVLSGFQQTHPPVSVSPIEIPDPIVPPPIWRGAFNIEVRAGGVATADFGSASEEGPSMITGLKWADLDGNARRDDREPGLGGVVIYSDANTNGKLDPGEPSTRTQMDNPDTDFDEGGFYWLTVDPGMHLVLEEVPLGYRQTYPNPGRRISFPYNLGQLATVKEGGATGGVDFGNHPVTTTGAVTGTTWNDGNGNGKRENSEPPIGGVRVYSDTNRNGRHEPGEWSTLSLQDDPATPEVETGRYRLESLPAGTHALRQVVPPGMLATSPMASLTATELARADLPPGVALDFKLLDVQATRDANQKATTTFTLEVTWPNGCGQVLPEASVAERVDGSVQIRVYGRQVGDICTLAIRSQQVTLVAPGATADKTAYEAQLWENTSPMLPAFGLSYQLEGTITPAGSDDHRVTIAYGDLLGDFDFGQRRDPNPPVIEGDLDENGQLNIQDVDLLAAALSVGATGPAKFDVNHDTAINGRDLDYLVEDLFKTQVGDVNLDYRFNSSDLVAIFQAGHFETGRQAHWSEGDWNADGRFNTSDLVAAFQAGGYEDEQPSG